MLTEDQGEIVRFLEAPSTHGGSAVERIDTHASVIFLAGSRAWKLKRAVRYDYLDFSTLDRRRTMCEAEVRVNRRTAPGLYRGVVPVTRESDGSLALGGIGRPVDWLVEMTRFDQAGLLDRLADRGGLDVDVMRALGVEIGSFHRNAERRFDHGGSAGMKWVVQGNASGFADEGHGVLDPAICARVTATAARALGNLAGVLDARRDTGHVRHCHGDLHLGNIVLLDGRPTLFDGVEFNDEIACIDVLYDASFLLMDLWRRKLPGHANAVWNAYLAATGDVDDLRLLPLYLSCRAAVRAKTSATAANLAGVDTRRRELAAAAREYLSLAEQLLHPAPASIVAIGGFSGTGKSTLARALAPILGAVPGAVVIRSDEIRKRLCGVDALQRLGPEGYTAAVSSRVYAAVFDLAARIAGSGHAVVADAVFARPADRLSMERAALQAGVPFVGVWLDAPEAELTVRLARRGRDASDADAAVVRHQLAEGAGAIAWTHVDAVPAAGDVAGAVSAVVQRRLGGSIRARDVDVFAHSPAG